MRNRADWMKMFQEVRGWMELLNAKNLSTKLNFDALIRELHHAVNANLDRFDKNEIYAPCDYVVRISKTEADELKRLKKFDLYQQKLEKTVQDYIRDNGYLTAEKTIRVRLERDDRLESGFLQVDVAFGAQESYKSKTVFRPPVGQSLAYVEWMNGPNKGDKIPLTKSKVTIGRISDDNHPDIGIEDARGWVGRRHGEIEQRGDRYYLRDLRSQNGTKLETADGVQTLAPDTPVELSDAAIILLADEFRLVFRLSDRLETNIRS